MTSAKTKINWGIAGLGKIAHRFCNDLVRQVENGQLYAVAARESDRAEAFAAQYRCQKSYGS